MIPSIIRWSVGNRFLVLLLTLMLTAWGSGRSNRPRWTPCRISPTSR